MTYNNRFLKIMLLIVSLSLIWSFPCVYAYWQYGEKVDISQERQFEIKYFPWKGEEILPDEGEEGETTQLSGLELIINALNNKGLTGTSLLNQYIDKRVKNFSKLEYGSVDQKEDVTALLSDVTENDIQLNFEFILSGKVVGSGKNAHVESFYLYMIDRTVYNGVMEKWDSAGISETNYQNDPSIFQEYFYPVNRVLIEKDAYDQWTPISAEEGYAGFGYYEGSNNGGGQKVWTFYPTSWNPGMP